MRQFEEMKKRFMERYTDAYQHAEAIKREANRALEASKRYQRIAARKMGEYHKLEHKSWDKKWSVHWHDLLKEILREVDERTGLNFSTDSLCTFGLRCETPVFAYNGEPHDHTTVIASLTFTPGDVEKGQIFLDSGENRGTYHPDSIGGMNGFGNATEEVTSIEVVIENLKRRFPELNL